MQIARPHTRFFRLVYDSPKQGDISALRAFGLNGTTYFPLFFPVFIKEFGREALPVGSAYNVGNAEVKSDKFLYVVNVIFGNFHRLKKEKLPFLVDKVCLSFDVRKIVGVVADKRNVLSLAHGPNGNGFPGIGKYAAVIGYASVLLKTAFTFPVKFVYVRNLADTTYNHLFGKVKLVTDFIVAKFMYVELFENLISPSRIGYTVARAIILLDRIKKHRALRIGGKEFHFQSQIHVAMMIHSFDKTANYNMYLLGASKA